MIQFIKPKLTISKFDVEYIITTSGVDPNPYPTKDPYETEIGGGGNTVPSDNVYAL